MLSSFSAVPLLEPTNLAGEDKGVFWSEDALAPWRFSAHRKERSRRRFELGTPGSSK